MAKPSHSDEKFLAGLAGALQTSDNGQLQKDRRWDASHYGNLEQFIYDYLTGGASAGESVRLKLQTPLFVAEALAQAAHRQLTDELETATQVQLAKPPSSPSPIPAHTVPTVMVPSSCRVLPCSDDFAHVLQGVAILDVVGLL